MEKAQNILNDAFWVVLKIIHLIPIAMALAVVFVAVYEAISNQLVTDGIMFELQFYLGSSVSNIIICFALFFNPKLKFCSFTKWTVFGLFLNVVLYKVGDYIPNIWYQKLYTILAFLIVYIGWLLYYYRNKTNN